MSPIIKVNELLVRYEKKIILNRINFDVSPGEIFVILGGSGCGKTTLLNHLIGLQKPESGDILIKNQNIVTANDEEKEKIAQLMGIMFQSGALFGSMNLKDNVALPLRELTHLPEALINEIVRIKLKLVGLGNFESFMPAEISGGMQKRAAIARAMVLDPEILFLDEPSAGLDPSTSAELDELIIYLSREFGMTFVVVTHELPSIYTIADRVIMLHEGSVIVTGKPSELKNHENSVVKQFFMRSSKTRTGNESK